MAAMKRMGIIYHLTHAAWGASGYRGFHAHLRKTALQSFYLVIGFRDPGQDGINFFDRGVAFMVKCVIVANLSVPKVTAFVVFPKYGLN